MQRSDQKICLQWSDFDDHVRSSFQELRSDQDFTDVTLACEDGKQVEAHKFILVSSSPFFRDLLKRNKHSHPLVYMRDIKSDIITSMVDFLYHGEARLFQEDLDSFLALATELQLKGLHEVTKVEMVDTGSEHARIQLLESACSSVRPSVRHEKIPHHRYMRQGQRSWIHASFIPASYTHASQSRIIGICIIQTCIRVKDRGS